MADRLISEQAVLDEVSRWRGYLDDDMINRIQIGMKRLPTAQSEKRTEERTGTHACDCISRKAATEAVIDADYND